MKQLISRRSFLKAAGVTTAVAAVSLGAPAASACYPGSFKDITILYTNDVHTYIDKKSPELTYAAIAALKKSYQDAGKNVLPGCSMLGLYHTHAEDANPSALQNPRSMV